jgi:hypothetical protein
MTDVIFGGSTPKGNLVWGPTALPAQATTLLDPSTGADPYWEIVHSFAWNLPGLPSSSEVESQCQMPFHRAAVVRASK